MAARATAHYGRQLSRRGLARAGSAKTMTMRRQQPRFAEGADADALGAALSPLLAQEGPGRWSLTAAGDGIERSFKFKTFAKTWVGSGRSPSPPPLPRATVMSRTEQPPPREACRDACRGVVALQQLLAFFVMG